MTDTSAHSTAGAAPSPAAPSAKAAGEKTAYLDVRDLKVHFPTDDGIVKAVAFVLLAATLALQSAASPWVEPVWALAQVASWISLVLCIVRGVPVLFEARAWDRKK